MSSLAGGQLDRETPAGLAALLWLVHPSVLGAPRNRVCQLRISSYLRGAPWHVDCTGPYHMERVRLRNLLLSLGKLQSTRPWLVVAIALITLVPAGWGSVLLFSDVRTSFGELLPDNKASVIEARRVADRMGGTSTLTLVAEAPEGGDPEDLKLFVDEVTPSLQAMDKKWVTSVDTGTAAIEAFFQKNKHLYVSLSDIENLHEEVEARWDYEVGRETGTSLGMDDEPPEPITAESVRNHLQKKVDETTNKASKGVDGYYIGEDERGLIAAILIRTPLGTATREAFEFRGRVQEIVDEFTARHPDSGIQAYYTGSAITSAEQRAAIESDLARVGVSGVLLVLLVVFLFFLRVRMLVAMGATILVGCVWTFGVAQLTVGHLNTATMFLASIIAGNGINFGIIYMARYVEERRHQAQGMQRLSSEERQARVADAIQTSHIDTYRATLAASCAAGVAYASLAATDFHGFKHFGIIAGAGMLLCWAATYCVLPAVLVISERARPMFEGEKPWRLKLRGFYGYPFAWVARRFSRTVAVVGIGAGLACAALTIRYVADDPMEYDFRNIRNEAGAPTSAVVLSRRVDGIVGRIGQDGYAILTDRVDQVPPLVTELKRRRDAAPADKKPFSKVVSIHDLLPAEQDEKLSLLKETDALLARARKRGYIDEETWAEIAPHIPERLAAINMADLPELVARPFIERDGTRGRAVYIAPADDESVYNARYLMRWADGFREVQLENGERIQGTGNPVIFSDMLLNIREDAPVAIGLSLFGTLVIILIAFRGRAAGWGALAALVLGVLYLVGVLAALDIKLNFLNFVAIPIGIGVGADYVINLMKRREISHEGDLNRVLIETGGAVVLCSLTTTLGYAALLMSINKAVAGFGLAAALGEITTLVAAMLVLPAILFWKLRRRTGQLPDATAATFSDETARAASLATDPALLSRTAQTDPSNEALGSGEPLA